MEDRGPACGWGGAGAGIGGSAVYSTSIQDLNRSVGERAQLLHGYLIHLCTRLAWIWSVHVWLILLFMEIFFDRRLVHMSFLVLLTADIRLLKCDMMLLGQEMIDLKLGLDG